MGSCASGLRFQHAFDLVSARDLHAAVLSIEEWTAAQERSRATGKGVSKIHANNQKATQTLDADTGMYTQIEHRRCRS